MDKYTHFRAHALAVSASMILVLILGWLAYQPAIPGFFLLDDFDNLGTLQAGVTDMSSLRNYLEDGKAGPLGRPIAKLSFLLDDNAWPSEPGPFKHTNLLIHLLIGVLAFALGRMILRPFVARAHADWIALAVAAVWLLHPMQLSTVMYVVQRMTQLASLFIIVGIAIHTALRLRPDFGNRHLPWLTVSLGLFTLLAVFSKESGILLPVYLLVVEFTVLSHLSYTRQFQWWRRICLVLPTLGLLAYLAYLPRWLGSYATRDFTLVERLITQPVVLLDYLRALFSMRVSGLGLFHDDFPIYSSLLHPIPLASAALLAAALISALWLRKRWPLYSFGVLWFLAGHLLEGTTVSLELYFEHRNYLPMFGPILALFVGIHQGMTRISQEDLHRVPPFLAIAVLAIAGFSTWGHANEWGDRLRLLSIWAAEHPDSPRAQRSYAHVLAGANQVSGALDTLDYAYERFPYDLSIPLMSIDIACRFDRPLRYQLQELIPQIPNHRWTDALRPVLQSLFTNIHKTKCQAQTADLHALVPALFTIQDEHLWHRAIAGIYVLSGNLYLEEQDPSGALTAFLIVDNIQPSPSSALRLSNFYLLVQDFTEASRYLDLAEARDNQNQPWKRRNRSEEYAEKRAMIDHIETAMGKHREQANSSSDVASGAD